MSKIIMSNELIHRIALVKRGCGETEEGDPYESWNAMGSVWAKLVFQTPSDKESSMVVNVVMRPTLKKFDGMIWRGKQFVKRGEVIEDPKTFRWKGFLQNKLY